MFNRCMCVWCCNVPVFLQERRELLANLSGKVTAAVEERRKLEAAEGGRRQKLLTRVPTPEAVEETTPADADAPVEPAAATA